MSIIISSTLRRFNEAIINDHIGYAGINDTGAQEALEPKTVIANCKTQIKEERVAEIRTTLIDMLKAFCLQNPRLSDPKSANQILLKVTEPSPTRCKDTDGYKFLSLILENETTGTTAKDLGCHLDQRFIKSIASGDRETAIADINSFRGTALNRLKLHGGASKKRGFISRFFGQNTTNSAGTETLRRLESLLRHVVDKFIDTEPGISREAINAEIARRSLEDLSKALPDARPAPFLPTMHTATQQADGAEEDGCTSLIVGGPGLSIDTFDRFCKNPIVLSKDEADPTRTETERIKADFHKVLQERNLLKPFGYSKIGDNTLEFKIRPQTANGDEEALLSLLWENRTNNSTETRAKLDRYKFTNALMSGDFEGARSQIFTFLEESNNITNADVFEASLSDARKHLRELRTALLQFVDDYEAEPEGIPSPS